MHDPTNATRCYAWSNKCYTQGDPFIPGYKLVFRWISALCDGYVAWREFIRQLGQMCFFNDLVNNNGVPKFLVREDEHRIISL